MKHQSRAGIQSTPLAARTLHNCLAFAASVLSSGSNGPYPEGPRPRSGARRDRTMPACLTSTIPLLPLPGSGAQLHLLVPAAGIVQSRTQSRLIFAVGICRMEGTVCAAIGDLAGSGRYRGDSRRWRQRSSQVPSTAENPRGTSQIGAGQIPNCRTNCAFRHPAGWLFRPRESAGIASGFGQFRRREPAGAARRLAIGSGSSGSLDCGCQTCGHGSVAPGPANRGRGPSVRAATTASGPRRRTPNSYAVSLPPTAWTVSPLATDVFQFSCLVSGPSLPVNSWTGGPGDAGNKSHFPLGARA